MIWGSDFRIACVLLVHGIKLHVFSCHRHNSGHGKLVATLPQASSHLLQRGLHQQQQQQQQRQQQ